MRHGCEVDAIDILYEDNHIIAAVKQPGILSQQDATGAPDMLTLLKAYIKEKYGKPGDVYLGLVHRLDRPAGGVMLFARTSKAASRLSEQIRTGKVDKRYYAVLTRVPEEPAGVLNGYMIKDEKTNVSRMALPGERGAKLCTLAYETVAEINGMAMVEVDLRTGRSHQIRVQMADAGWPLAGDAKYGDGGCSLALWSHSIAFDHPVKKERMLIECDPPRSYPWELFNR